MINRDDSNLIWQLAWSDFKLRYRGSIFGVAWSFLKPFSMLAVLFFIFRYIVRIEIDNYASYLFLGIILWNFFSEATSISMHNLVEKRNIIKSVYIKKELLVLSSCINAFIGFLINFCIYIILSFVIGGRVSISLWVLLPILLLLLSALSFSYILSAFFIKYRDLSHIWEILLQLGFLMTPIFYSKDMVPKEFAIITYINPLSAVIDGFREVMLYGRGLDAVYYSIMIIVLVSFYFAAYKIYKRQSLYFAEGL